jgi:hypothetical protein
MVLYIAQNNYLRIFPSSEFIKTTAFHKSILFSSAGEQYERIPTMFHDLRVTLPSRFYPVFTSCEDVKRINFRNSMFLGLSNI